MTELSVAECENIVKNCVKSEVRTLTSEIVPLSDDNFILKVTIHDGVNERTLNFFAKTSLKKPKIYQILFDDFKNAIPRFNPKITPELYYGKANLLFFEDLSWQGFQVCAKEDLDLDHVKVVLKVLAKFHSGNLAYEEIKTKETGERFTLDQKYKVDGFRINLKTTEVVELLSTLTNQDDLVELVEDLEGRQNSQKSRRTLCHGNLMVRNIMFKYDQDAPIDCKLLNFKATQYVPPIFDFLQLLFFATSEDFRQHHLEDLLFYYHRCLCEDLKQYLLEPESYEQLRKEAHYFLPIIKLEKALRFKNHQFSAALHETLTCPILSREDCYTIVTNKLKSPNFKLISFVVTPLDKANGYLGTYHKLTIKIFHQTEQTINCFVKSIPKNDASRNIVNEANCFLKEIFIYQTLAPQMRKIDTFNQCLAPCYFYRSEELAVFEDFATLNYQTLPAQVPYDLPLLALTVKKVAQFHASTILFEEMKSKELDRKYRLGDEYQKYLQEIYFSLEQHSGAVLMQVGVRSIIDVINLFPELKTEQNQKNFNRWWPKLQTLFFEVTLPSRVYRNVVSHGDLWTNNIMVKLDGTQPIDCVFVDFQCTRYCPPAHDFLSVIYLTTDRTTRLTHEDELKTFYYQEFAKILGDYGYSADDIYPHDEFLQSVEYTRPQMVLQTIIYRMFTMCTPDEISSFLVDDETAKFVFFKDRKEYLTKICEKSPTVKTYLRECLLDLYSLCDGFIDV